MDSAGFINVLKPPGMSSHDVVQYIRRLTSTRRVGHGGTLDPLAAGVLPVAVGQACRLLEYLEDDKEYRAELMLGYRYDTDDLDGRCIKETDASFVNESRLRECLQGFVGEIWQVPPSASAIKVEGQRLYEALRQGRAVQPPARRVTLYSTKLLGFTPGRHPVARLHVHCSAGTYIRALCRDIGDRLGVGGVMSFLVRSRSGAFRIERSVTLEGLAEQVRVIPPREVLGHLPTHWVPRESVRAVRDGAYVADAGGMFEGAIVRLVSERDELLAIGVVRNGRIGVKKLIQDR
ncbi:MAG: tRNA pseudouridine(55) synthase TruB [Bacillota bacterium]